MTCKKVVVVNEVGTTPSAGMDELAVDVQNTVESHQQTAVQLARLTVQAHGLLSCLVYCRHFRVSQLTFVS